MMAGPLHFGVNQTLICYKVIICNIVEIIVINVNRREIKRTIVLSLSGQYNGSIHSQCVCLYAYIGGV